ncbi:hypothetical protein K0038_00330 [Pseudomonas syringae]|nr:hypothetical protein [Pseudomonas syringae]
MQFEQRLDTVLLALTNRFAQPVHRLLFLIGGGLDAAPTSRTIDQHFRDQTCCAVAPGYTLLFLIGNQALQPGARAFQ